MKLELKLNHEIVRRLHAYRRFGVGEKTLDQAVEELLEEALVAHRARQQFLCGGQGEFRREAEADTDYEGEFC